MRWWKDIFLMECKKVLSYRVDFWFQFGVVVCTEVGIAYYLWKTIFEENNISQISGMSFEQILIYYCLMPFVVRFVKSSDDFSISREIYEGGINKYLIYPISYTITKVLERAAFSAMAAFQMAVGFFIISYFVPIFKYALFENIFLALICMATSFFLYFLMSFCLELMAFWFDSVWSLGVMLRFFTMFFGGAMIPLAFFPSSVQVVLNLTPFPYLFSFPVKVILGQVVFMDILLAILITLAWIFPLLIVMKYILRNGLKKYSGVGL